MVRVILDFGLPLKRAGSPASVARPAEPAKVIVRVWRIPGGGTADTDHADRGTP